MSGESFFDLKRGQQRDALLAASETLGREPHILEKDIMVVATLDAIYTSEFKDLLYFKGGTSLSKVYGLINRFSEDLDLTYDMTKFLDGGNFDEDGIPPSGSQASKLTETVRKRLPEWIKGEFAPIMERSMADRGIKVILAYNSSETLNVDFESRFDGHSYVRSSVLLEFGARSTGRPAQQHAIACDTAQANTGLVFPTASVQAMAVERTFWEKATAAHVYCLQQNLKKERFSRHWHDLHYIHKSKHWESALKDGELAGKVARHKSFFFKEKDKDGQAVDYARAVSGEMVLVPSGTALKDLEKDYRIMRESGITAADAPDFEAIMQSCKDMELAINKALRPEKDCA
ncbi:nucleotidyl transferase AbiEii/AbiGii toxin family protein [Mesorhizobium sp. M2C.T.Ca.TU.002.02.1.1]|uniref:nucleotidyl transferase AbiEii/AbiGii toxin family protein n=1 Tax=Mesorhizobium sp. M2C.T.Ca.TU.002.02.1.1 TaxID=2496788 RepID=UPI000FCC4E1F|nr:nucleotidyl transferase AbiEii/AbiGii toxin family protein [Mesorhizobium sp. M2C.T.Ca.TU.002.02.1.1]RUU54492.1 nucleotidyl transferase AbiEii/AbiGii toxin family protein [Mesorhizobium sp. M2C.T.Ca.TU.002.02.1.1]RUU72032.1 nucleotidyl transferase AbiEii/AbiGii toxin family protein [Mesorhizobium sp. M2C.T.Ca.TU.009.01.2.1]